jgi:hypothetical protein
VTKLDHVARRGDHQVAELGNVLGPIGDDQRLLVSVKIAFERVGGIFPAETRAGEPVRNVVKIWGNMPVDPLHQWVGNVERQVKLVAVFWNERQAEKRAANPVVFGVEKIAH